MSEIGKTLVALCNEGDFSGAIKTLYADDIESVEPLCPQIPEDQRIARGLEAVKKKSADWLASNEVHAAKASGPFPHDERFLVVFELDVTPKQGPMAGQRLQMQEVGLYTVKDDKIAKEEFFYSMG